MKKQELNKSYCKVLDDLNWWYDVPTEKGLVKITYCTTLLTFTAYLSADNFENELKAEYSKFDNVKFMRNYYDSIKDETNEFLPNFLQVIEEIKQIKESLENLVTKIVESKYKVFDKEMMFAIFVRKDGQEKLAAICDKYSQEDCIKEIMYDEGCTDGATELNADGFFNSLGNLDTVYRKTIDNEFDYNSAIPDFSIRSESYPLNEVNIK